MNLLMTFIQKAIGQGVAILFGATGEIVTEKSGNLNLGIPGIMYMGGIYGLMGAFFYENGKENPNGFVGLLIAFLATLIVSALGGLIYSFLTITLRANQNVVGLALTTFGVGFGNFFGGSISKLAGGVGQISVQTTAAAFRAKIPGLSAIPVIGDLFISYWFSDLFIRDPCHMYDLFSEKDQTRLKLTRSRGEPGDCRCCRYQCIKIQIHCNCDRSSNRRSWRTLFCHGISRRNLV